MQNWIMIVVRNDLEALSKPELKEVAMMVQAHSGGKGLDLRWGVEKLKGYIRDRFNEVKQAASDRLLVTNEGCWDIDTDAYWKAPYCVLTCELPVTTQTIITTEMPEALDELFWKAFGKLILEQQLKNSTFEITTAWLSSILEDCERRRMKTFDLTNHLLKDEELYRNLAGKHFRTDKNLSDIFQTLFGEKKYVELLLRMSMLDTTPNDDIYHLILDNLRYIQNVRSLSTLKHKTLVAKGNLLNYWDYYDWFNPTLGDRIALQSQIPRIADWFIETIKKGDRYNLVEVDVFSDGCEPEYPTTYAKVKESALKAAHMIIYTSSYNWVKNQFGYGYISEKSLNKKDPDTITLVFYPQWFPDSSRPFSGNTTMFRAYHPDKARHPWMNETLS